MRRWRAGMLVIACAAGLGGIGACGSDAADLQTATPGLDQDAAVDGDSAVKPDSGGGEAAVDGGCAAGSTSCSGSCVNLSSDEANCGSCGTRLLRSDDLPAGQVRVSLRGDRLWQRVRGAEVRPGSLRSLQHRVSGQSGVQSWLLQPDVQWRPDELLRRLRGFVVRPHRLRRLRERMRRWDLVRGRDVPVPGGRVLVLRNLREALHGPASLRNVRHPVRGGGGLLGRRVSVTMRRRLHGLRGSMRVALLGPVELRSMRHLLSS